MPDDLTTFVALVRSMRKSQKDYFRSKDYNTLLDSKRYEGMVDKWIENFDRKRVEPPLFPDLPF